MHSILRIAAVLSLIVSAACTSDRVVGRYNSALCKVNDGDAKPCVTPIAVAFAVSIKTPPASSPTSGGVFPERALAEYIAALSSNPDWSPNPAALRANLAAPLIPPPTPQETVDQTVFHRTVIVSVRKENFNPVDRLEATTVTIKLDHARFDSWDTLVTPYTTINAGTIQLTQARGTTEGLTASAPATAAFPLSLTLGGSQTDTRVENLAAMEQKEAVSVTVDKDGVLTIFRQGGYGIDLTGNTIIKVDLTYIGESRSIYMHSVTYNGKDDKPLPPVEVKLTATPATTPDLGAKVTAQVGLTYTIRHVVKGGDTYEESDDDIVETTITNKDPQTVVLIPEREVVPANFALYEHAGEHRLVEAQMAGASSSSVLCFATYESAQTFLRFLRGPARAQPGKLANATVGFHEANPQKPRFNELRTADLDSLFVMAGCIPHK